MKFLDLFFFRRKKNGVETFIGYERNMTPQSTFRYDAPDPGDFVEPTEYEKEIGQAEERQRKSREATAICPMDLKICPILG